MAGIALVAHNRGIKVSGSDLKPSKYLEALLASGVTVSFGHHSEALDDPSIELVVISTAIPADNPEVKAARDRNLEIWPRAKMLAWLAREHRLLAVTGTHGKTTTSSMLACALYELGADPTFLVGGVVHSVQASAYSGGGECFVVEADESDSSFVHLDPSLAIITNIEVDHTDHFSCLREVREAFRAFLAKLRPEGVAIVCADDVQLLALAREQGRQVISYGLAKDADYQLLKNAVDENAAAFGRNPRANVPAAAAAPSELAPGVSTTDPLLSRFAVRTPDGQILQLSLAASPGRHNMLNATAVLAALDWLGFRRSDSVLALRAFAGVGRRFEVIGRAGEITVVDDYAHHPTEVNATLQAAHDAGFKRVHVLFQPHRYTRTEAFMEQFATAFEAAQTLFLMPIYTAGESAIDGVSSEALAQAIQRHQPEAVVQVLGEREGIPARLAAVASPGDCIICMGAGDVTQEAPRVLAELVARTAAVATQDGEQPLQLTTLQQAPSVAAVVQSVGQ
jgi:UDP-N-acetylmuramate--alanine ligase